MNAVILLLVSFCFFSGCPLAFAGEHIYGNSNAINKITIPPNKHNSEGNNDDESANAEYLNIKKAFSPNLGEFFLYSVMPGTNRIGLLSYDGQSTISTSITQLNYEQVKIIECGGREGFIPRPSIYNHEDIMGVTGYERHDYSCYIARNNEYKWFDGSSLGVNIWYSKDLNGDMQCYSLDGANCIWMPDYKKNFLIGDNNTLRDLNNNQYKIAEYLRGNNQLTIKTIDVSWVQNIKLPNSTAQGKRLSVEVKSTWPVIVHLPSGKQSEVRNGEKQSWIYLGGEWFDESSNINLYSTIMQQAQPLACGAEHKRVWGTTGYNQKGHWCNTLIGSENSYTKNTLQSIINSKYVHMDRLFSQMDSYEVLRVDKDNNYPSRISDLSRRLNDKKEQKNIACNGFWWNIPGLIACAIFSSEYDDLLGAYNSLVRERDNKKKSARDKVEVGRNTLWHELHKKWVQNDNTHFFALLKEESETLEELMAIKSEYDKEASQAYADYLSALQKYMSDSAPQNILINALEDMPLIGREVKNIIDYASNPSGKNLRKMLLGLVGPVGEAIEGGIEITTEDGVLNNSTLTYLTHVLTDLREDNSIGEALEDIVSDAIHDLGDNAIESIRQAGLWVDNPSEDNLMEINYKNIIDLRSRSERIEYDFWRGSSIEEVNVQRNFTPENFNFKKFIGDSSSYKQDSMIDIEYASGGSKFENRLTAIFTHAFGVGYEQIVKKSFLYTSWNHAKINNELYKVIADPAYYEARQPYWVDSSIIGHRPAGLIYNSKHAFIVINRDLVSREGADFYKFYFEELGHMVNWWRCKIFDINVSSCNITGDAGARFRDAILLDKRLHNTKFESLLTELPTYPQVDVNVLKFSDGSFATLEGWPNYYTMNDHIAGGGKFSWLMRLGLDVTSNDFNFISDEFDMEITIGAPRPAMRDNPWKKSENGYCKTDADTDCNMPTMWISISFRDALKLSIAKTPQVKDSSFAKVGFDLSPRLVRKHGGKLPFQLTSVSGTQWSYKSYYNIYSKKFTAGLEAKLDFWKMGHAIAGKVPNKVHKPEFSLKTTPVSGSYLVEISTRDTEDFAGWLAGDIASSIAGCAAGFAIGVVADIDPVVLCHGMSDISEAVETAFQGLDKKPTMLFESDGSVTLPVSLEYKYATSGTNIAGNSSSDAQNFNSGRVTYNSDTGTNVWFTDANIHPMSSTADQQIVSFKEKVSRSFSKIAKSTFSPVAVFRFRVGFDYAEKVLQKGAYALPSAIVED